MTRDHIGENYVLDLKETLVANFMYIIYGIICFAGFWSSLRFISTLPQETQFLPIMGLMLALPAILRSAPSFQPVYKHRIITFYEEPSPELEVERR